MTLVELLQPLSVLEHVGDLTGEVFAITDDSRQVQPGSCFVAVQGEHVDGHDFVQLAVRQGAVGVVVERPLVSTIPSSSACLVRVPHSRRALGLLASRMVGAPSQQLGMIGVTGTNGKTTVTHLSRALLEKGGQKTGLIGTVGYCIDSEWTAATHTTPGAVVLQGLLARMVEAHLDAAVLEVSSHALALERLAGCEFDTVVFTNLTQDHLDFHGSMETYFASKSRLFTDYVGHQNTTRPKRAIINVDDDWGRQLVSCCSIPVWTYGITSAADIRACDVRLSLDTTHCTVETPMGRMLMQSPLVGQHNVSNILASIGVGLQAGIPLPVLQAALQTIGKVPGRFERIMEGQPFTVIVDYAHTDDALDRLLAAAQTLTTGRIVTVFGCGGDRDRGKRPKMGRVAAERSDCLFLTSDNPRSEDPLEILRDIEQGVLSLASHERAHYQIISDRRKAIHAAMKEAKSGDMVLIAGKGHEDYQWLGDQRIHFDDRVVAREALQSLTRSG
ncbi:MAG: UDP-N-acetylmuramoyl-L-alanyl-D-glutamate--2,6-diaminopimelate ligase [Nitrospirales bacterium]|nr:UDP-N-acetylmuramoyl-L-alanyl-D-glutamate--2,6-diaminopimelate ligase [Nitrospirales bacterium]